MPTQDLSLFQAMTAKMRYLEQRQKVLAENIANADTPHYQPMDVAEPDFKALLSRSTSLSTSTPDLAVTNGRHLTASGATAGTLEGKEKRQRDGYEVSPDGNAVVIEEQLMKASTNVNDHRFITNLYQKNIQMLKMATSGSSQ